MRRSQLVMDFSVHPLREDRWPTILGYVDTDDVIYIYISHQKTHSMGLSAQPISVVEASKNVADETLQLTIIGYNAYVITELQLIGAWLQPYGPDQHHIG